MSNPSESVPPEGAEIPPDETPAVEAAPVAAQPAVTLDVVKSIVTEAVSEAVTGVSKLLLAAQAAGQRVETVPAEPVDVSDAEIDAAVARGESVAPLLSRRVSAAVARETREMRAELARVRDYGTTSLNALAQAQAASSEDYRTYEKEIREELERVAPELRSHPEVLQRTRDMVVGRHVGEIRAVEREKGARQARTPVVTSAGPGGANGRTEPAKADGPQLSDLFDEAGLRAIREAGGIDEVAKRFNMSTDDYLKTAKEMRGING